MSFLDPVIDSIESLMAWIGSAALKQDFASYCDLETADNKGVLVAKDGSLVSVIRIDGITHLVGREEFDRIASGVARSLTAYMQGNGHGLQSFFMRDPEFVRREIEESLAPAVQTIKKLQLDVADLLKERVANMTRYCSHESNYLVLWTRPSALTPDQIKTDGKQKGEFIKVNKPAPAKDAQYMLRAMPALRNRHASFVRSVLSDFKELGLKMEHIDVHTACHAARMTIDPDFTDLSWRPYLPGDKIPMRDTGRYGRDISDLMWPKLGDQIMARDAEQVDMKTVKIGNRYYAPMYMEIYPQEVQSFMRLFRRISDHDMPWRVSFMIEPSGLTAVRLKSMLASILSFASTDNKLIKASVNALKTMEIEGGEAVVKLRIAFATWARSEAQLHERASTMARAIQGWGICDVRDVAGDVTEAFVSSALAISSHNVANPAAAPLPEVTQMLPLMRPASPWVSGAILFRSPDGKLMPYQPGSSKQDAWIDLVYGPMGSGKSVFMATCDLASCLAPGIERLPLIAIIDVGPSASGLIDLLKEALPPEKKHLAAYYRLRMSTDYAINPFDTQLGCRYPVLPERAFIVNFLTLLATPIGKEEPYNSAAEMAGLLVDEVYKMLDDRPKRYEQYVDETVDQALASFGFRPETHTSWFDVVDALKDRNMIHEASIAQRYAMPLLSDLVTVCNSQAVRDIYGKVTVETNESLVDAFTRMISSALREYPILSQPTSFDVGDARVVALDLDEVARGGGAAAERQGELMYMLARHVAARHFYLLPDMVNEMPERYQAYHAERIQYIREDVKKIRFDEYHRVKSKAVRGQLKLDVREGRKWGVQVVLGSQLLEDFDDEVVKLASSVFILKAGTPQAAADSAKTFALSDSAKVVLERDCTGPKAGGATFIAWFNTKNGVTVQALTSTLGPIELWAFSTTVEDVAIRKRLYAMMPPHEARLKLAKAFPGGSAKDEVERRKGSLRDDEAEAVMDEIAKEIAAID